MITRDSLIKYLNENPKDLSKEERDDMFREFRDVEIARKEEEDEDEPFGFSTHLENMFMAMYEDDLEGYITSKKDQVELIKSNHPETTGAEKWDFASPFPDIVPEFVLLGDDEGNMWEFYNGRLIRTTNIYLNSLQPHLSSFGEGTPAGLELKRLLESGEIKNFPNEGKPLSRARF